MSNWNTHEFETILEKQLKIELGADQGQIKFSRYVEFRSGLNRHIYPQIIGREPRLTDHSAVHIQNIFSNILRLLGDDIEKLTSMDLYVLALCVLFHDVGNIYARSGHKWRIPDIYKFVTSEASFSLREMTNIRLAAEAHGGSTVDGSEDTLRQVNIQGDLDGKPIRLRDIACILRLADELAEGPQRRNFFYVRENIQDEHGVALIPPSSWKYHEYAKITQILIDRPNERIAITYDIDLPKDGSELEYLHKMLEFVQLRITKTDIERKYVKHYSELLLPFRRVSVQFNFYRGSIPCHAIDGIVLEDEPIIPTEENTRKISKSFFERFPKCNPDEIWDEINGVKTKLQ